MIVIGNVKMYNGMNNIKILKSDNGLILCVLRIFYIIHSLHYSSVAIIQTNSCTELNNWQLHN